MYRRSQSVQPFHHNTQSRHTSGSDPGPGPNARRFLCRPAEDCSPFFRLIIVNGKFDICLPPDKLPLPAHLPHPLGQTPPKVKGKGSPYSITGRRVQELIPVFGSQPAGDVSHKPGSRLPLLSARPAVTPATLTRAATNFADWWTEARWVWTVCPRLLPDSVATAFLTRAFC